MREIKSKKKFYSSDTIEILEIPYFTNFNIVYYSSVIGRCDE